jgi:hypothetical protein
MRLEGSTWRTFPHPDKENYRFKFDINLAYSHKTECICMRIVFFNFLILHANYFTFAQKHYL